MVRDGFPTTTSVDEATFMAIQKGNVVFAAIRDAATKTLRSTWWQFDQNGLGYRAIDRAIQRLRKAGRIKQVSRGRWALADAEVA